MTGALPGRDDGKNRAGIGIPVSAREMSSEKALLAALQARRTSNSQGCKSQLKVSDVDRRRKIINLNGDFARVFPPRCWRQVHRAPAKREEVDHNWLGIELVLAWGRGNMEH